MTAPVSPDPAPVDPTAPPVDDSTPQAQPDDSLDDSLDLPENLEAARKLRSENRNLRERSKTAETDLTAARGQLDALRQQAVEAIAGAALRDVRDFTDRYPDVAQFLDADGNVDPEAVTTAAQALTTDRPHFAADPVVTAPPTNRPLESLRPGASTGERGPTPSWGSVMRRTIKP